MTLADTLLNEVSFRRDLQAWENTVLDEPAVRGLFANWTGVATQEPSGVELTFEQEGVSSPARPPPGWGSWRNE